MTEPAAVWENAVLAASLFAVDPAGLGGVSLRASAGPVRDRWIALLRGVLPPKPACGGCPVMWRMAVCSAVWICQRHFRPDVLLWSAVS